MKNVKKRFLIIISLISTCLIILVCIFIFKNYNFLKNPTLSPFYNNGSTFGDGNAICESWGLFFPLYFSSIIILLLPIMFYYLDHYNDVLSHKIKLIVLLLFAVIMEYFFGLFSLIIKFGGIGILMLYSVLAYFFLRKNISENKWMYIIQNIVLCILNSGLFGLWFYSKCD